MEQLGPRGTIKTTTSGPSFSVTLLKLEKKFAVMVGACAPTHLILVPLGRGGVSGFHLSGVPHDDEEVAAYAEAIAFVKERASKRRVVGRGCEGKLGAHSELSPLKRNTTLRRNGIGQPRNLLSLGTGRIGKRNTLQQRLAF